MSKKKEEIYNYWIFLIFANLIKQDISRVFNLAKNTRKY